ncbi:18053_t:CDS:2, partial [Dentiscutata erythropus]
SNEAVLLGQNKDDIEGFLFDYEKELIRTKCTWKNLNEEIVKIINAKSADVIKINRLRNIKQGEKETVREFASRFEAYLDPIKDSIKEKTKESVLLIENFQKDRERIDNKKGILATEERAQSNDADVEGITMALGALTINRVKQETNNVSRIDKLEENMKEITKMFKQFIENQETSEHTNTRNQDTTRPRKQNSMSRQCFVCQRKGHVACSCLNKVVQGQLEQRNDQREIRPENIDNRDVNICYFEIMDTSLNSGVECLKT